MGRATYSESLVVKKVTYKFNYSEYSFHSGSTHTQHKQSPWDD